MPIYHSKKKINKIYHNSKQIMEVFQNNKLDYSWYYPEGTILTGELDELNFPYGYPFNQASGDFSNFICKKIKPTAQIQFEIYFKKTSDQLPVIDQFTYKNEMFYVSTILMNNFGETLVEVINHNNENDWSEGGGSFALSMSSSNITTIDGKAISGVRYVNLMTYAPKDNKGERSKVEIGINVYWSSGGSSSWSIKKMKIVNNHL